jgi:hypothetical protein
MDEYAAKHEVQTAAPTPHFDSQGREESSENVWNSPQASLRIF